MHIRNFNLIMMLIAGIIVTIISIISGYSLDRLMYTLVIVLVVFFLIGTMIQGMLNGIADKADDKAREKRKKPFWMKKPLH